MKVMEAAVQCGIRTEILYGQSKGPPRLSYLPEEQRFVLRLPGDAQWVFDGTSSPAVQTLKERLGALCGSAEDIRRGFRFVDEHATRSH